MRFCTRGRLEPAFGGNRRGGFWLGSPAGGAGALALAHFYISCTQLARMDRHTRYAHRPHHHCALLFCVGNRCAWLILAGDHLRVVSPSDAESGGCVRGIVTNSRPSAWPLARTCTTQLYGDRRRQGPGRKGTSSTTRHGDRSPLLPSRSSSAS